MALGAVTRLKGPDQSHLRPPPSPTQSSQEPHLSSPWGLCWSYAVGTLVSICLVTDPVDPGLNLWAGFWAWSWTCLITVDLLGDH